MAPRKKRVTPPSSAKIIKRYGNRKLYDTEASHYVTLEEISHMVRSGQDVRVIDNKTQEDLTSVTLAQIMLEEEKNKKNAYPLFLLRNLIQLGGDSLTEWVQKGKESFTSMRQEGREQIYRIIEKGQETTEEGAQLLKEWLANQQRSIDMLQKRIDERIRYFFYHLTGLDDLEKQIQELEGKFNRLEKKLHQERR